MIPSHELLILDAGGAAQAALSPGAVQRALALGAGLRSEDLGAMIPIDRGRVAVEIATTRALRLATPMALQVQLGPPDAPRTLEPRRPVLMTLRREDDPPTDDAGEVMVRWHDGGPAPSPGAFAVALAEALAGAAGAESVGAAFFGDGFGHVALPASLVASRRLPAALDVAGRRFDLEPRGKKKP